MMMPCSPANFLRWVSRIFTLGVCVSAAEAGPRYGRQLSQRDPETSAGKNATLASCHPQCDNRSYAAPSTPWSAAWAVHDDDDAFATESRCALRPPTRHAERRSPGG